MARGPNVRKTQSEFDTTPSTKELTENYTVCIPVTTAWAGFCLKLETNCERWGWKIKACQYCVCFKQFQGTNTTWCQCFWMFHRQLPLIHSLSLPALLVCIAHYHLLLLQPPLMQLLWLSSMKTFYLLISILYNTNKCLGAITCNILA